MSFSDMGVMGKMWASSLSNGLQNDDLVMTGDGQPEVIK